MIKFVKETLLEDVGGVSAPMATLANVPGVGTATPATSADGSSTGSGDSWGDTSIGTAKNEGNINPYDKIGGMMAKKMGVNLAFKKKDSRTNTISQNNWEELDEDQPNNTTDIDKYISNPDYVLDNAKKRKLSESEIPYGISTLDDYIKASKHVPDHPLTKVKKGQPLTEADTVRDENALKDVNAKDTLTILGIGFEFKPGKSGINRVFITEPIKEVLKKLEQGEWEKYGKNPENTIQKFKKSEKIITIYADGKDLPRATVTNKVEENLNLRKKVSNSLEPYMK